MRNKDIIKQYVNTGNQITEYQFNKLNNSLLKSYLRKRFHYAHHLEDYEVVKMQPDMLIKYIDEQLKKLNYDVISGKLIYDTLRMLNDENKYKILDVYLQHKHAISRRVFIDENIFNETMIIYYIDAMVKVNPLKIAEYYLDFLDDDRLKNFISNLYDIKDSKVVNRIENEIVVEGGKGLEYLITAIINYNNTHKIPHTATNLLFRHMDDGKKMEYINSKLQSLYVDTKLSEREMMWLKENHKNILDNFLNFKINKDFMTSQEFNIADLNLQKKYIDKMIATGNPLHGYYFDGNDEAKEYWEKRKLNEK
jgi:hypothetical protein